MPLSRYDCIRLFISQTKCIVKIVTALSYNFGVDVKYFNQENASVTYIYI